MRSLSLLGLLLAACQRPDAAPVKAFDGPAAFRYLEAQMAGGPRIAGSANSARVAGWLDSLLRARADTVIHQAWWHTTVRGDSIQLHNLVARFRPAAERRVLFLAHWDTRPIADGPNSKDSTAAVPGANDGASGTAVLLGIADALKQVPPEVGVDLLFVDGEDFGIFNEHDNQDVLIGSRYYAQHQPPGPQPLFAMLLDMIGDKDLQIYHEGYSLTGAPEVVDLVWGVAADLGHAGTFVPSHRYDLIDDHKSLQDAGIRAIDVVDFDYPFWHTKDDTIDKVSAASLQIVGDVALAVIRRAARQ